MMNPSHPHHRSPSCCCCCTPIGSGSIVRCGRTIRSPGSVQPWRGRTRNVVAVGTVGREWRTIPSRNLRAVVAVRNRRITTVRRLPRVVIHLRYERREINRNSQEEEKGQPLALSVTVSSAVHQFGTDKLTRLLILSDVLESDS